LCFINPYPLNQLWSPLDLLALAAARVKVPCFPRHPMSSIPRPNKLSYSSNQPNNQCLMRILPAPRTAESQRQEERAQRCALALLRMCGTFVQDLDSSCYSLPTIAVTYAHFVGSTAKRIHHNRHRNHDSEYRDLGIDFN
jgi:hypothetical protein